MNIAFFGSSLVSSYRNAPATYYRGIIRALAERGHRITFFEPDTPEREQHRDLADPEWARVVAYRADDESGVHAALDEARHADLIVKASGIRVFDELLECAVPELRRADNIVAFWDVDVPATMDRAGDDAGAPLRACIPRYDLVLTYGGGAAVVRAYAELGARACVPIYNALDPATHHPVAHDARFAADLAFLGNRMPDRERRVDQFFLGVASSRPERQFVLGGSGWSDRAMTPNVRYVGHVYTRDHNAFNCTPLAVLNINRESTARVGYWPPARVFEAAGAGACLITDTWTGIELFLEPGEEILTARNGADVAAHLDQLDACRAYEIGNAAYRRMLDEHTYSHRAALLEHVLGAGTRGVVERVAP